MLHPAYGLAAATNHVDALPLGGTMKTALFNLEKLSTGAAQCGDGQEDTTELISYGAPRASLITRTEQPENSVGEMWVRGDNVALGYWLKPVQTAHTIRASSNEPSAGTPPGPWLRTGDLGVISEGEFLIAGRFEDLLIVDGRNHYPDDIEATTQEITGGRVAAIAVEDDATENLVVIIALEARGTADETADRKSVKHQFAVAVWQAYNLWVGDPVPVAPGSNPITTSGRTRRSSCAERYRKGEFQRLETVV